MQFTNDSFLSQWQRVVLRFPLRAERIQDQKDSAAMFLLVQRGLRSSGPGCYVQESKDQLVPHSRRP